jgi:hypothetical protein
MQETRGVGRASGFSWRLLPATCPLAFVNFTRAAHFLPMKPSKPDHTFLITNDLGSEIRLGVWPFN